MISYTARYWTLPFILAFATHATADFPKEDDYRNAPLESVCQREGDVFAANSTGIFHAHLKSRKWTKLKLPDDMPLDGSFAAVPRKSPLVLYVSSGLFGEYDDKGKHGIYLSRNNGESWNLVSEPQHYTSALLLPNGSLFAVTSDRRRVLQSKDMGKNWRDITGKSFGDINRIFPDPDHSGLICLNTHSIRGYVMQAMNEDYLWQPTREWLWHPERKEFFSQNYSTVMRATLNNYFRFDFGNGTYIPAFDVSPEKNRITPRVGETVAVPFTIRFHEDAGLHNWVWEEQRRKKGNSDPAPKPTTLTLIDDPSSFRFWGIRVEFQGQRTAENAAVWNEIASAPDRKAAQQKLLKSTAWNEVELSSSKPYHRQLNLSWLYPFAEPGTYKVQVTYDNELLADRDKGHWVGSFSSRVFEVVITGNQQ